METVLVVGATGNIGVAAILGALQAKRNVLAIVRNQTSADKLFQHIRSKEGITIVEADIMAEDGVQGVVDRVRAGKLPAFQHVYSAAGGAYGVTPLRDVTTSELRKFMTINFESNFFAYRATIPYLLEQQGSTSFTLCTGSQGDIGARAAPAISQGPLYSLANVACRDNDETSVRFNEVYLGTRVEVDSVAEQTGALKASEFANVYAELLAQPEIKSSRISVAGRDDLKELKHKKKIAY